MAQDGDAARRKRITQVLAEARGTSPATVKRDWATAKLWLYNELMAG